jgi:hypothetical protein
VVITGQNASQLPSGPNVITLPDCPCRAYENSIDANLESADPAQAKDFLNALHGEGQIEIRASSLVATSIAMVDGKPHIFLANFSGLRGGSNPIPTPQKDITLRLRNQAKVRFLPFLGNVQDVRGTRDGDGFVYHLPGVERGAVVSIEK